MEDFFSLIFIKAHKSFSLIKRPSSLFFGRIFFSKNSFSPLTYKWINHFQTSLCRNYFSHKKQKKKSSFQVRETPKMIIRKWLKGLATIVPEFFFFTWICTENQHIIHHWKNPIWQWNQTIVQYINFFCQWSFQSCMSK